MNKRQVLRIDFFVQALLLGLALGAGAWNWYGGQGSSWAWLFFLLFVIWQFFSSIYVAAEFRSWHRGIPPGALLVQITLVILLAAMNVPVTVSAIILLLMFLTLLVSLALSAVDWYRIEFLKNETRWKAKQETILDTDDVFK